MLRSAGLFSHLQCPFTHDSPGCPRPHCQYGHGTPEASGGESGSDREEAAASHPAATPLKEPQVIGKKLQELERINKAIEVVKTEVEEKQKKLLLYQNVTHDIKKSTEPQIDSNSNMSSCPQEDQSYAVILKRTSLTTASGSKRHANSVFTKKYVIDRSCPATDLEYDPLLNFSAGLLGSTAKDGESQSIQKLLMCDEDPEDKVNKKPRSVSPIRLEIKLQESDDDDDVLVIDVPPLQAISKKQRITKFEERTEDMPVYDQIQEHTDNCINSSAEQTNIATEETVNESKDFDVEESASFPVSPKACSVNSVTNNDIMVQTIKSQNHGICLTDLSKTSVGSKLIELNEVALDHKNEFSMNCREDIQELTQMEDVTMPKSDGQTNFLLEEMCIKEKQYFPSNAQNLETVNHITNLPVLDQCVTEVSTELTSLTHDPKSQEEILIPETQILTPKDSSSEVTDDSDDDPEISDSDDPMEECLRIFNEFAEKETKKEIMQTCQEDHSEVDLAETKANDSVSGQKKRIAHSSKSDVKSSNSILVPYRGPTPQHMNHARILHVQQQAVQITAAVKSGQAFVASTQKKNTGCVSPAFHNFGQIVCLNLVEVQPVMPSRNQFSGFSQGSSLATTTLRANMPQKRTLQTTPMKIPSRKRSSGVLEIGAKVPHETRQRYVNSFVEEFLKDSSNVQEAFVKAQMEEKAIYDRCGSKNMYLSIAVNSLKKLRDQRNISINSSQQSRSRDNTFGLRRQDEKNELTGINLYNILKEYLLSDEQLQENGYPRPNPEKPGSALLCNVAAKSIVNDALRRVCCRCGKIYSVTLQGKHVRKEECTYHSGKVLRHRVPGGMETRYSCCEAVVGTPGCQVAKVTNTTNKNRSGLICTVEKMRHQIIAVSENGGICTHRMVNFDLHVHDGQKENLDGFLKTFIKLQPSDGNPGVFSLDCEMCYTTHGLELTRVTVVDPSLQIIYETFVKPDNEILDYNTRFSGVTEENLTNITTSIRDVQAIMLNLFSADTILIGHGLENDLVALKLIHDTVVDTAIVFPHRLGLPHKRALRNLMADYLRRIIQDNVGGHDSSEDAAACMELMLWKVKEDGKGRR